MKKVVLLLLLGSLVGNLAACGVKNNLAKPNGQETPRTERDPSQPPTPVGR